MPPPQVLLGLTSLTDITSDQKRNLSELLVLPMPVHASPAVTWVVTATSKAEDPCFHIRYIGWMRSAFELRNIAQLIHEDQFPYHKSMANDKSFPLWAYKDATKQIELFFAKQHERIQDLLKEAAQNPQTMLDIMFKFVGYLEEGSYFFLHTWERFIFQTIIEPHHCDVVLEDMLTPHHTVRFSQFARPGPERQEINFFFETKALSIKKAMGDVEDHGVLRFHKEQFPLRIRVDEGGNLCYGVKEQHVYRQYIDVFTMYEYFLFCDSDNVLGNAWSWDPSVLSVNH